MKISLILPYWQRQEAADKALESLRMSYADMTDELEIIVVDDGNAVPFRWDGPLNVRVISLPQKDGPKCPATPINAGVQAATGEVIVLSCVEILHGSPVLGEMLAQLEALGEDGYVLASVWCPEEAKWHCHSTVKVPQNPAGTGLHFCAMLKKSLFERAGGFDEAYREGAGYEDNDWINRLLSVGAKFCIRDDLVVTHPKTGARSAWKPEQFARNEAIFRSKWTKPVTFVCLLKTGGEYGPEYVNNLKDMLTRNLLAGYPGRFVCLTDDATGLDDGIEVLPLPEDLERWWGKLYLFKRGLFPDGERMVFMDLDTLIVGGMEEILSYEGEFATLRDFYFPDRLGPAVMLWKAGGRASSIWEEWEAAGKPRNPLGDLWWINQLDGGVFARKVDVLQDLHPGAFRSFKAHCNPMPPKGTKVVCFHGQPRPHNCEAEWVKDVWRIGGGGLADMELVPNIVHQKIVANVKTNAERDLPWLGLIGPRQGHAVIVGGGPSLAGVMDEIRWRKSRGHTVIALAGAAHYLKRNGILADWQVLLDSKPETVKFALPEVPQHFVCSQCDPAMFDALSGENVCVFHVNSAATLEALEGGREAHLVSTGSTVGLIAMGIAYTQGFRNLHLYGMDSSYADKTRHHAYEQKLNDADRTIEAVVGGRTFLCAPWMVAQADQFQELALQLMEADCTITVAGDGLLPHVARLLSQPQEIAA